MPDIPGTAEVVIKGVSSRMVKNNTLKLFEVETAEGTKWTTFKEPLARAAHALAGKPALISYKITNNGEFTNYQLNEIGPAAPGGEFAAATPDPFAAPPEPQKEITFQEFANVEQERKEAEEKKRQSIHRQVATKVSAELSKDSAEFWSNVKDLYLFYERAIIPAQTSSVTSHADVSPFDDTQPAEDDGIPF